ncbi:MAG: response regulator [Bacteroidales bacterium]
MRIKYHASISKIDYWFGFFMTHYCPATGLKVFTISEWQNNKVSDTFTANFWIINDSIVYSRPSGYADIKGVKQSLSLNNSVFEYINGINSPFVQIEDYIDLNGSSAEARRYFSTEMNHNANLSTLIFCNLSQPLSIAVKLGNRFNTTGRPINVKKDYLDAINFAFQCCGQKMGNSDRSPINLKSYNTKGSTSLSPVELLLKKEWNFQTHDYSNNAIVIDQTILHSTSKGRLYKEHIPHIDLMRSKVLASLPDKARIEFIVVDTSELKSGSRKARAQYMKSLKDWHKENPLKMYIAYGTNTFMKTALHLAKPLLPFKIRSADDINHAFQLIDNEKSTSWAKKLRHKDKTKRDIVLKYEQYEQLLAFIGELDWEKKSIISEIKLKEDNPLFFLHQSLNLIKEELEQLLEERQNAEEALRESLQKLEFALQGWNLGMWDWNPQDGTVVYSDLWAQMLEYRPDEVDPTVEFFKQHVHPEDLAAVLDRLTGHVEGRLPIYESEHRIRAKSGKWLWVLDRGMIAERDKDGRPVRVTGLIADITERIEAQKEQEKLQVQLSKLQKSESLGRMAGSIAHHFNNQLSVVLGNLELVLDGLPDDADNREILVQSFEAGRKATEVSQQMLRYLGHISGNQTAINLSDVCRQSLAFLQSASPSGVTFNVDFPDSGPIVHADAGQIQQVLTNLLTNAQESLPENQGIIGLIIQTVSHEDISTSNCFPLDWHPQDKPYACLEISDTGHGISREDIEKLFDPFYTTKFTGRGMGLPVTMGILKTHNGCITVDSEPEIGTVFRVYLPVTTDKKPVKHEKVTTPKRKVGNCGTVLLIEDDTSVRNTAKIMISRLGYKVIEAQDGVEAVSLFQEHQNEIDCVLSDLTMPRMNGWETLKALREKGTDVPVILASGYDENTVMAGDHPELPQAFLNKPYSMAALKDVLMEVIRL